MKKNVWIGVLILFAIQVGALLYAQKSYSGQSLRRWELTRQRLLGEGIASEQALAIASEIHSSETSVASELWNVGHLGSSVACMMILLVALNKSGEA